VIDYVDAGEEWRQRIAEEWDEKAARHMHFGDGFSILALHEGKPVGLIAVAWKKLAPPLEDTLEGYIDIIEVRPGFRRQGIARKMTELAAERACGAKAYQLRAWSRQDKTEALPMWRALGFALNPVTHRMWGPELTGYFAVRTLVRPA
jgi:ribosomal protein S18 acetylase RimI-like enzyme